MTEQFDLGDGFRAEVAHLDGSALIDLIGEWDLAGHEAFRAT